MIAEKPSWVRHEGTQIFSIDVQPGGLRFAAGGGDHKDMIRMFLTSPGLNLREPGKTLRCFKNMQISGATSIPKQQPSRIVLDLESSMR